MPPQEFKSFKWFKSFKSIPDSFNDLNSLNVWNARSAALPLRNLVAQFLGDFRRQTVISHFIEDNLAIGEAALCL